MRICTMRKSVWNNNYIMCMLKLSIIGVLFKILYCICICTRTVYIHMFCNIARYCNI